MKTSALILVACGLPGTTAANLRSLTSAEDISQINDKQPDDHMDGDIVGTAGILSSRPGSYRAIKKRIDCNRILEETTDQCYFLYRIQEKGAEIFDIEPTQTALVTGAGFDVFATTFNTIEGTLPPAGDYVTFLAYGAAGDEQANQGYIESPALSEDECGTYVRVTWGQSFGSLPNEGVANSATLSVGGTVVDTILNTAAEKKVTIVPYKPGDTVKITELSTAGGVDSSIGVFYSIEICNLESDEYSTYRNQKPPPSVHSMSYVDFEDKKKNPDDAAKGRVTRGAPAQKPPTGYRKEGEPSVYSMYYGDNEK